MATNRLYVLRINARELLRQPGLTKDIAVALTPPELGVDDARLTGDVSITLRAVSAIDGIAVHGSIAVPWATVCRRCLGPVSGTAEIDVDEMYRDDVGPDDDAFEIEGDQIDLAPAIREYVLLELPDAQVCRDDCAGLCPVCGNDRNATPCDCDASVRDDRWAALDDLRLDEN